MFLVLNGKKSNNDALMYVSLAYRWNLILFFDICAYEYVLFGAGIACVITLAY